MLMSKQKAGKISIIASSLLLLSANLSAFEPVEIISSPAPEKTITAASKEAASPEAASPEVTPSEATTKDGQTKKPDTQARAKQKKCNYDMPKDEWLDDIRRSTYSGLCKSVSWVDHLFGDKYEFNDHDFRGKVSLGFRQDSISGFDPRLRVKIKTKLPNLSKRFNAFIGRVNEDSYISNTEVKKGQVNAVGLRSDDDENAQWLVGLGYRNPNDRSNGFDYSAGIKLSSGLDPYAKVAHRHVFTPSENDFWRTTNTLFWRRTDGFGFSSNLDYTHILGDHDILEWSTQVKVTEKEDELEWITGTTWHHSINEKEGISSRIYIRGEEEKNEPIGEYGITFTYVRPFLKPWLLIETGVDFRWEQEYHNDPYKSATRFGIQLQMLLGDYYQRNK